MKTNKLLIFCLTGAFFAAGWLGTASAQEMDDDEAQPTVRQRGNVQRGEGARPQGRQRPVEAARPESAKSEAVQPLTAAEIQILRQIIADYRNSQSGQGAAAKAAPERQRGPGDAAAAPQGPQGRGMSPEMRERMLERFDTDGDGVLSPEERRVARETMQRERQQRAEQEQ